MGDTVLFYGPTRNIIPNANARRTVSFRRKVAPVVVSVVYAAQKADLTFDKDLQNATLGDFAVLLNAVPDAVVSTIIDSINKKLLTVSWTTPGLGTNPVVIDYTSGTLAGLSGVLVATFQESGVIP